MLVSAHKLNCTFMRDERNGRDITFLLLDIILYIVTKIYPFPSSFRGYK